MNIRHHRLKLHFRIVSEKFLQSCRQAKSCLFPNATILSLLGYTNMGTAKQHNIAAGSGSTKSVKITFRR
jgi:hypothetical protein